MKKSIENVKYIEFEMINRDAILIDTEHLLNLSVENIHVSHKYDSFMQKLLEYKYCEFLYVLISKSAKEVFPRLLKEHDIIGISYLSVNKNLIDEIYVLWNDDEAEENSNQITKLNEKGNFEITIKGD